MAVFCAVLSQPLNARHGDSRLLLCAWREGHMSSNCAVFPDRERILRVRSEVLTSDFHAPQTCVLTAAPCNAVERLSASGRYRMGEPAFRTRDALVCQVQQRRGA